MDAGTVSSLFVYPVKACAGVPCTTVTIGRFGFEGDREFQVVGDDGNYLTQRQIPQMALVRAEPAPGGVVLSSAAAGSIEVERPPLADVDTKVTYATARAGDCGEGVARWLERVLGRPCRLVAITNGYRRPLAIEVEAPDIEVSFADVAPILLANTASLDDLVARASEPFDMARFRPNLVVTDDDPWVEDTWRRVRIGTTTVHALLPWPRCAVPQIDQHTAERHSEPAKVLHEHRWCTDSSGLGPSWVRPGVVNKALFGVGAAAEPLGSTISVGATVEVIESRVPVLAAPAPLATRTADRSG